VFSVIQKAVFVDFGAAASAKRLSEMGAQLIISNISFRAIIRSSSGSGIRLRDALPRRYLEN